MSMVLAIGLAATVLLALAIELVWLEHAPRGWQDATTFHFGEEPYDGTAMPAEAEPRETPSSPARPTRQSAVTLPIRCADRG